MDRIISFFDFPDFGFVCSFLCLLFLPFFLLCCLQALFHLNGMGFDIRTADGMPRFLFLCEDANLRGIWLITVELRFRSTAISSSAF